MRKRKHRHTFVLEGVYYAPVLIVGTNLTIRRVEDRKVYKHICEKCKRTRIVSPEGYTSGASDHDLQLFPREIINMLPDKYKTVLALKEIKKLPICDITDIVGCKYSTTQKRIQRASEIAKELLKKGVR